MSNIIRLTQNFYQQCQKAANNNNSQELIKAKYTGWDSVETQILGLKIATDLPWIDWKNVKSVLDIGCGYGALLEFLASTLSYEEEYCGIDIIPNFILEAILNYGSKYKSCFITGDFLERDWNSQKFDVVISLGGICVNHDYPNQYGQKSLEYARKFITKTVDISNQAISLYFPNADNTKVKYHKLLACYKISEIESMIIKACDRRLTDLTFVSYPDESEAMTIAKIKLSS